MREKTAPGVEGPRPVAWARAGLSRGIHKICPKAELR